MNEAATGKKSKDKVVTIIINGQEKEVDKGAITYEEVVHLAFPQAPTGPNVQIIIKYSRGESGKNGSLIAGESVQTKEGMVFHVTPTDKS